LAIELLAIRSGHRASHRRRDVHRTGVGDHEAARLGTQAHRVGRGSHRLRNCFQGRAATVEPEEQRINQRGKVDQTATILVVDDDVMLLGGASRLLTGAGYEVLEAGSGREAMRLVEEHEPDLVAIDVVLGDATGIDVCREIKDRGIIENVDVILLSSLKTASESQAAGLEAGVDDYIARPVSNRELPARVDALLHLKRARDALGRQTERLNREVAERKRAERALDEHRKHLEEVIEERTRELQEAQERLLRRDKLTMLGQLAGGVSHELRPVNVNEVLE